MVESEEMVLELNSTSREVGLTSPEKNFEYERYKNPINGNYRYRNNICIHIFRTKIDTPRSYTNIEKNSAGRVWKLRNEFKDLFHNI